MVAAGVLLGFASASAVVSWSLMQKYAWPGIDLDIMLELGHRWRETGTMYLPYQVSGPYFVAAIASDLAQTPGLYPPAVGPLFALLAFVPRPLLTAAWWIVPVAAVAWSIRGWRPAPWAWLVMAACLAWPLSMMVVVAGGTTMWATAAVALGLRFGWPAALVLVKPSLAPFALVGARDRRWWITSAVVVVLTFAGPWQDYIVAARNAQGLDYAIGSYPLMLLPIVAYLGRTKAAAPEGTTVGVPSRVVTPKRPASR